MPPFYRKASLRSELNKRNNKDRRASSIVQAIVHNRRNDITQCLFNKSTNKSNDNCLKVPELKYGIWSHFGSSSLSTDEELKFDYQQQQQQQNSSLATLNDDNSDIRNDVISMHTFSISYSDSVGGGQNESKLIDNNQQSSALEEKRGSTGNQRLKRLHRQSTASIMTSTIDDNYQSASSQPPPINIDDNILFTMKTSGSDETISTGDNIGASDDNDNRQDEDEHGFIDTFIDDNDNDDKINEVSLNQKSKFLYLKKILNFIKAI